MWGSERQLDDYLRGRLARALEELAGLDPDVLLNENADVLVAALLGKHLPVEIAVDWDGPTRSPVSEVKTQVRDFFDRDVVYTVPASKVVVSFPITGTTEMLDYRASTFSLSPEHGKVTDGAVVVEVIERTLDAEAVRHEIDRVRQSVERRVGWVNADLAKFRPSAEQAIRDAYAHRRERILNDRAVEDALGIPVRTSAVARPPVAAYRKQVTLQTRRTQSAFVPEPVLEEAIYQDVLSAVRSWGNTLERTPGTAAKLEEEELRDLLLGTLNGYWQGAAGGELFNGSGKTDILIREGDRNVFIAECKIWRGPKSAADAVDQLLSYLVWRDSKAALVMFVKAHDTAAAIAKLRAAIEEHPRHALTKDVSDPSQRADYVVTADDEGRRVSLAVVPIVIRVKST